MRFFGVVTFSANVGFILAPFLGENPISFTPPNIVILKCKDF